MMIYTFYSYKGGVGRSMALANIAELFYQSGLKVLMVDWDLEAPGLERFFDLPSEVVLKQPGIIDLILEYKRKVANVIDEKPQKSKAQEELGLPLPDIDSFCIDVYKEKMSKGSLMLMPAGRRDAENFVSYVGNIRSFDWLDFYQNWEGERFFAWLYREFKNLADVVLIDSRTGVSEMGGVCVYQMADAVVMFCAANNQSIDGTFKMAADFKESNTKKLRGGRSLEIVIIPSRVEDRAEYSLLKKFQNDFISRFGERNFSGKNALAFSIKKMWNLKIPHVPYYAFQESVVVRDAKDKLKEYEDMYNTFRRIHVQLSLLAPKNSNVRKSIQTRSVDIGGSTVDVVITGDKNIIVAGDLIGRDKTIVNLTMFRNAYLLRLYESARSLSLTGIDPKTASETEAHLNLEAVYTALLTLTPETHERLLRGEHLEKETRRLSALEQLNQHHRLVLLGDPGSGKTTFVNFVVLCLAGEALQREQANLAVLRAPLLADDKDEKKKERQPWEHGALLPVRIILRDFAARGLPEADEKAGAEHLWNFIADELKAWPDYAPQLRDELLNKGGLVLLDGLDEVPEANQRRIQIKQVVEDFAACFPRCRILVTSRTYAYQKQDWRLPQFSEAVLAPFSAGQIRRFVEHWYGHIGAVRGLQTEDAQGRAELLKSAIFHSDRLTALAERPLLLTLMASLHAWRGGSLPEKREELYNDTVDLLLDWWERPKAVREASGQVRVEQPSLAEWLKVDRQKVRELLNALAFEAHRGQPDLVGTADVPEDKLIIGLMRLSNNPDAKPALLIKYLSERAGLLLPRGIEVYTFPHRTFQEYLAACYLTDHDYPDQLAELVKVEPNRWREVALLAGAKASRGTASAAWNLVEALCYRDITPSSALPEIWGAHLAGQALAEIADLNLISPRHQEKKSRVQQGLLHILQRHNFPAIERALAGNSLARLGDPREEVMTVEKMQFCLVPAGPFWMGSEEDEDEKPLHRNEHLNDDYWMARYPVTNAQFAEFVQAGGYKTERYWPEAKAAKVWQDAQVKAYNDDKARSQPDDFGAPFNLPNHPVVGITWYEMLAFTRWLTEMGHEKKWLDESMKIDLPSEAEWEKAARGGEEILPSPLIISLDKILTEQYTIEPRKPNEKPQRRYPWGDDEADPNRANYNDTKIGATNAVGCFPDSVSPYGCEEMSGNVWEWTRSLWGNKYPYDLNDGRENLEAPNNVARVLRGGTFYSDASAVRCAFRLRGNPYFRNSHFGFRLLARPLSF